MVSECSEDAVSTVRGFLNCINVLFFKYSGTVTWLQWS